METSTTTPLYERAEHAARVIRAQYLEEARIGLILGSGLGAFADDLEDAVAVSYEEIPGFARSTVEGHAGRLVIGKVAGTTLIVLQGRFHYYEGYGLEEVTFPVRVLGLLGIKA